MEHKHSPRVLRGVRGRVGCIELNRPEAMNALDIEMVSTIFETLRGWEHDPRVASVLITGAGDRAFCAGGDIRASQDPNAGFTSEEFLRVEYALNLLISEYSKPYIAVMHGLVLGGGLGVSAHGSHRIVTGTSRLGTPEVGIGFIPDAGMTRILANLDSEYGTHLALTGAIIGPGEAIEWGLADHYVPSDAIGCLIEELREGTPDDVVSRWSRTPPTSDSADAREWMARCYRGDDAEEIVQRLMVDADPRARAAGEEIVQRSPTAVKLALRALRAAREDSSLAISLDREFRVAVRAFASAELAEGVRARLIDRDRRPRWNPARLADVGPSILDPYFAIVDPPLDLRPPGRVTTPRPRAASSSPAR